MAISDEDKRSPVSALRYSSNRYPGFGLRSVSGYGTPAAASSPAAVPNAASSRGANPLLSVRAGDGGDRTRERRTKGDPLDANTLERNYQTHDFLNSPIGQVASSAAGVVPGVGNLLSLGSGIVRSATGGWLANDAQKGYNAGRRGGLTPSEAKSTTDAGLGEDDFQSAGDGPGTNGLTKAGASGTINKGYRPGDVVAESLPDPTGYTGGDGGSDGRDGRAERGGGDYGSSAGGPSGRDMHGGSGAVDHDGSDNDSQGGYGGDSSVDAAETEAGMSSMSSGGTGGSGGSGGGGRVICTHMMRIGLMDAELWRADLTYTANHSSPTTVRGYHFWAIPYVRLMRRDNWIGRFSVRVMEPIARHRAEELAYQIGQRDTPNYRGKAVRLVLEPLSWMIGCVVDQKDWRVLYMERG